MEAELRSEAHLLRVAVRNDARPFTACPEQRAALARLAVVESTVAVLVREVGELKVQRRGAGARDQADATLLRVIAEVMGDREWTCVQLWRHRKATAALRDALLAADIDSRRQLGKRCKLMSKGQPVNGLQVENVNPNHPTRDGLIWRVRVCEL